LIIFFLSFYSVKIDTILNGNIIKTGYKNIVKNSDTIICGEDTLKRNIDYSIDYSNGEIYFYKIYDCSINLIFYVMPSFLKQSYSLIEKTDEKNEIEEVKDSINIEGKSGIFFDFSKNGNSFEQGIDVKIGGKVGEFNIDGVINDNNIPYEMGIIGLTDVENLYLNIYSNDKRFIIGNFQRGRKKITGAGGRYKILEFYTGISGMKSGSLILKGFDGVSQYKIKDEEGNEIDIVQGSLRVFLNGEILKEKEDYNFDYEKKEIIFSPKRIIRSSDVIYINFQYFSNGAKQMLYSANLNTEKIGLNFSSEEDFEEKFLLRKAIPDSNIAYVYDANFVGYGKGDYELEDSFFIFKGVKKGSYIVNFRYAGENNGEYEYLDTLGYFVYTGKGKWSATKKVPLYGKNRILNIKVNIGNRWIKFNSQNEFTDKEISLIDTTNFSYTAYENLTFIFPIINFNIEYFKNNNFRREIEWVEKGRIQSIWGKENNNYAILKSDIKPLNFLTLSSGYGFGENRLLNLGLVISSFKVEFMDVKDYKREINSYYNFREIKLKANTKRFKEFYTKEIGFEKKDILISTGRKGRYDIKEDIDTSCFYNIFFNAQSRFLTYSGNAVIEKSLINGGRRFNFNNTLKTGMERKDFNYNLLFNLSENIKNIMVSVYKRVEDGFGNYSYDSLNKKYYEDPYGNFVREFVPSDSMERIRTFNINFNSRYIKYFYIDLGIQFLKDKLNLQESYNLFIKSPEFFDLNIFGEYRKNRSEYHFSNDIDFFESYSSGINLKKSMTAGYSQESRKQEKRRFLFLKYGKELNLNIRTGIIYFNQSIFFITFNPEFDIKRKFLNANLGFDVSYYKTEYPNILYTEGITFSITPNIIFNISNYRLIFKGLGRIDGKGKIFSFRLGIETEIKK